MGGELNPRYSIVTPTIQRQSLIACCQSVDSQSCTDWQHVCVVDCEQWNLSLMAKISHPQRIITKCGHRHNDFGHSCTRNAYHMLTGDYVHRLDDDNILAHPHVLEQMKVVTADWALFPIERLGERFFCDPPQYGHVDTGSVLVKREFAQWTDSTRYEADWDFISKLMAEHPNYQAFPDMDPIMILPVVSRGE